MAITLKDNELQHIENGITSLQKYEVRGKIGALQGYLSPHYRKTSVLGRETLLVNLTMLQPTGDTTFDIVTAVDIPFPVLTPINAFTLPAIPDKTLVLLEGEYVLYNPCICSRSGREHAGQRAQLTNTLSPITCRVDYRGMAQEVPSTLDKLFAEFFVRRSGDLADTITHTKDEDTAAFFTKMNNLPNEDRPLCPLVALQEIDSKLFLMASTEHLTPIAVQGPVG